MLKDLIAESAKQFEEKIDVQWRNHPGHISIKTVAKEEYKKGVTSAFALGRQSILDEFSHDQKKLLDGFSHPTDCKMCLALQSKLTTKE